MLFLVKKKPDIFVHAIQTQNIFSILNCSNGAESRGRQDEATQIAERGLLIFGRVLNTFVLFTRIFTNDSLVQSSYVFEGMVFYNAMVL